MNTANTNVVDIIDAYMAKLMTTPDEIVMDGVDPVKLQKEIDQMLASAEAEIAQRSS